MSPKPALAALLLAVAVGASGCGSDEPASVPRATDSGTPSASGSPSVSPSATATTSSPAVGLPEDFPAQDEVPLVAGVVTSKTGGKDPDGRIGYVLELTAVGSQQECFDRAAAALVDRGYVKQGEIKAGDTRQAQFTTADWAVIISARADGENCRLGYEVGQLAK